MIKKNEMDELNRISNIKSQREELNAVLNLQLYEKQN